MGKIDNLKWVGIDTGSTTIKLVIYEQTSQTTQIYRRHHSQPRAVLIRALQEILDKEGDFTALFSICGSAGKQLSDLTGQYFIQEVLANSIAVQKLYPRTRTAIELGGQDAKVIFYNHDPVTDRITASDMRMNGVCAGGTGAFIDEIAALLKIPAGKFDAYAHNGKRIYDISGRCGVFAKTDIQPLLNQGIDREDLALSCFHAIAKQTIGGLAQGMEIHGPVIFEGGPLFFNSRLIDVFRERLGLTDDEVIVPEHPETIVAAGAALYWENPIKKAEPLTLSTFIKRLEANHSHDTVKHYSIQRRRFFKNDKEHRAFLRRIVTGDSPAARNMEPGTILPVYLGIDAGSTTTKFVLINEAEEVVDRFYKANGGEPLNVTRNALLDMDKRYRERGILLDIKGVGTTGYGELLFAQAFNADHHQVETISHATAARKYEPDVTFILDIGGQDMKAISMGNTVITDICLNEACSAGCGSFIENYASNLRVPVHEIAERAFMSDNPSDLGSRCTVFMNSSIISAQSKGASTEDILAGLCFSIVENVFSKVLRISNFDRLGEKIVVQGGTFKNNAVLRAFELYLGKHVVRAPYPGEMGAIGIALLTKEKLTGEDSQGSESIGFKRLRDFTYRTKSGDVCELCSNHCRRTIIRFSEKNFFVTGNRCERGQALSKDDRRKRKHTPDLLRKRESLLFKDYLKPGINIEPRTRIGIPRVLEFWESAPFWKVLFESLGFEVFFSHHSSMKLYEHGLATIPSDTACFPAKLAHGHIIDLAGHGVDYIFYPIQLEKLIRSGNKRSRNLCALVQGYSVVLKNNIETVKKHGIPFLNPTFQWRTVKARRKQLIEFFKKHFDLASRDVAKAITRADEAQTLFEQDLVQQGRTLLKILQEQKEWGVVIVGRSYHNDSLINHYISRFFTRQEIPVFTADSLPGIDDIQLQGLLPDMVNPFHDRIFRAAVYAARHPDLELVQIVSFGCGHDAVISDEVKRIMNTLSGKEPLILKMDESENDGPLNIRVKSFIETVCTGRTGGMRKKQTERGVLPDPFVPKYTKGDRKKRVLMIPTLSPSFTELVTEVINSEGYPAVVLPQAGMRALELAKKYVHNDICYPAQLNIGEGLAFLENAPHSPECYAMAVPKNCVDCRLTHYAALARKALDEAGYTNTPVVTTDVDVQNMHPGLYFGNSFKWKMIWGLALIDSVEEVTRRCRTYALDSEAVNALYLRYRTSIIKKVVTNIPAAITLLKEFITAINLLEMYPGDSFPRVLIVGELLLNYHPTSNLNLEKYLQDHGMETIIPRFTDFFRMEYMRYRGEMKKYYIRYPLFDAMFYDIIDHIFSVVINRIDAIESSFKLYMPRTDTYRIFERTKKFFDINFTCGEGWLLPGEIMTYADKGIKSIVVVQPFGCMPNHVTGRGLFKAIKNKYPDIRLLALDYDPDTSISNIENRLQMLVMNAKWQHRK